MFAKSILVLQVCGGFHIFYLYYNDEQGTVKPQSCIMLCIG